MAFDVSGIFQRLFNFENDRDNNIKILASRMDDELDNFKGGLDAIVDGTQPFLNHVGLPNGLIDAPAVRFQADQDQGFYRNAAGEIAFVQGGIERFTIGGAKTKIPYDAHVGRVITGGFGALATSGVLDFNDITNARGGSGYSLLKGSTAANAPEDNDAFYHSFSFEYGAGKDGSGNLTQLAIPYTNGKMFFRTKSGTTFRDWRQLIDSRDIAPFTDASALDTGIVPPARLAGGVYDITAFTSSAMIVHGANKSNPHNVTKAQVGLSNVDNTADVDKPVPTAVTNAIDAKLNKTGGTVTGSLSVEGGIISKGSGYYLSPNDGRQRINVITSSSSIGAYVIWEQPDGANNAYIGGVTDDYIRFYTYGGRYVRFHERPRHDGDMLVIESEVALKESYESAEVAWVANTIETFAHGLGVVPKVIDARLKMKTTVHGFANNSELQIAKGQYGAAVWADATNIYVRSSTANGIYQSEGDGGYSYITPADANMIVKAYI